MGVNQRMILGLWIQSYCKKPARPKSTLAWSPDEYKSSSRVEDKFRKGLLMERKLFEDGKLAKITLTSRITSPRVNLTIAVTVRNCCNYCCYCVKVLLLLLLLCKIAVTLAVTV